MANLFSINRNTLLWTMILVLAVCYPFYESMDISVGIGILFAVLVLWDLGTVMVGQISFLHLITLNYLLQHFLASLMLYFYPPPADYNIYEISHYRYPSYLLFAVSGCIALYIGMMLASRGLEPKPFNRQSAKLDLPAWALYANHFFWFGQLFYAASLFSSRDSGSASGVSFLLVLLSSLRYVGLFTMILTRRKYWWVYAVPVFSVDMFTSLSGGMFHSLILWGGALFLICAYRYKWQAKAIFLLFMAFILLFMLQDIKQDYRKRISLLSDNSVVDEISSMKDLIMDRLTYPEILLEPNHLPLTLVRFNQGWIVDKVMLHVPDLEPYAYGSTIVEALYAAIIPRVIAPDKPLAGGQQNFFIYTGTRLPSSTSMNIGVAGEMYANFGPYGGVIGMGVFGYIIGRLYMLLQRKAVENPVWWAWAPFCGHYAMKAEEGFMEIATWIIKSVIVMAIIIFIANRAAAKQAAASGNRIP